MSEKKYHHHQQNWNSEINFDPTQRDKLLHMMVSGGVATVAKSLGMNSLQAFLISVLGFGIPKEIIDSYTHYGDINDLIADVIGAGIGSFLNFNIRF